MEENRFFKWLWRINAIGLFLLLCVALFSFIDEQLRRHRQVSTPPEPITSLADDPEGVEKWILEGNRNILEESNYLILPLVSEYSKVKEAKRMYYATTNNIAQYSNETAKNILFIEKRSSQASWLFPTNNQLIVQYRTLLNQTYYTEKKGPKEKILFYKIIDKDTNGDKIVTREDKQSFAVSTISGKKYRVVIRDIERIIEIGYNEKDEMYLVYQKSGKGYTLRLDCKSLETIENMQLPKVGMN